MGTDLFTSHRGAGVIGTLLALIVIGGFSLLALFVFDDRLQGGRSIEHVIKEEGKHLERLGKRLATSEDELSEAARRQEIADRLEQVERAANVASLSLQRCREDRERSVEEVDKLEAEMADYRQRYRESARAAAKGEEIPELTLLSGKVYKDVTVREVDAIRMQIRHSAGFTGVPLEDLPAEWQDRLQVSMEEKEDAVEEEGDNEEIRHLLADIAETRTGIKRVEGHIQNCRKQAKALEEKIALARTREPMVQQMILQEEQNLAQEKQKSRAGQGVSDAPQIEARIRQLKAQVNALRKVEPDARKEIASLEEEIEELTPDLDSRMDRMNSQLEQLKTKRAEVKAKRAESS